jgi:adenosine kinase
LIECLNYSNYLILNDYEYSLFLNKTWLQESDLLKKLDKIIVTLWKDWVKVIDKKQELKIKAVKNITVVDPTWAGDAFRAGLIVWLHNSLDWEKSLKLWCVSASYCIEKYGTQNHTFTKKQFEKKFKDEYKEKIEL